jgi:hypothetical protein
LCDAWYLRREVGIGISNRPQLIYEPNAFNVGNNFVFQHWSMDDMIAPRGRWMRARE